MKRSEALNSIFDHLSLMKRQDELAMDILDALEDLGMLPPATSVTLAGQTYTDNGWEPENTFGENLIEAAKEALEYHKKKTEKK